MTTENLRAEADMLERDAGGHISTTSALLRAAADRIDDLVAMAKNANDKLEVVSGSIKCHGSHAAMNA